MSRPAALAAALLSLSACATAAPPPAAPVDPSMASPSTSGPNDPSARGYLQPGAVDGTILLGPPPAPDSIRGKADQAAFDASRSMAGSPRWQAAIRDNDLWNGTALKSYSCAIGRDIGQATTPTLAKLLHKVEVDVRTVSAPVKAFYARKRPLIGNDKPICVPREPWMQTNGSYPSGHSMTGWSWSLVLGELQPAHATEVMVVGREMGVSRLVCGVHYESDVEAGRTLASAMVSRLHAEPGFMADMAAARRELERAPAPTGCAG